MLLRLVPLLFVSPLSAQCPTWAPGFGASGTSAPVHDVAVFDDGSGPALWLAGGFTSAGDAVGSRDLDPAALRQRYPHPPSCAPTTPTSGR